MDIARVGDHGGHIGIVAQGRDSGEWGVTVGGQGSNCFIFLYFWNGPQDGEGMASAGAGMREWKERGV